MVVAWMVAAPSIRLISLKVAGSRRTSASPGSWTVQMPACVGMKTHISALGNEMLCSGVNGTASGGIRRTGAAVGGAVGMDDPLGAIDALAEASTAVDAIGPPATDP